MASFRDALIGAVLGAVATPAVGAFIFLSGKGYETAINTITARVVSQLSIELEYKPYQSKGYDFFATCGKDEKLISGICYLGEGSGNLQNSGISFEKEKNEWRYICNYDRRADPVRGVAMAACLKPN
jgi:hypothetical protein